MLTYLVLAWKFSIQEQIGQVLAKIWAFKAWLNQPIIRQVQVQVIMGYACYAGCWNVTKDHRIIAGTHLPTIKTEESCKEECIKDSTCVAIDWSANGVDCWIHKSTDKYTSYSVYQLNPVCSGWSSCLLLPQTTSHNYLGGGVTVRCLTCDQEVADSIHGLELLRNHSGQVVHTHVPLSPSSVITGCAV